MALSSLYFKGLTVKISIKICFYVPKGCFHLGSSSPSSLFAKEPVTGMRNDRG